MRVLFISHEANNTGAPMALLQTLRVLKRTAPDIDFELLLKNDGPNRALFEELCPVILCDYSEPLLYRIKRKLNILNDVCPAYLQKIDLSGFDVVYANSVVSLNTAILIKHRYDVPIVLHCHESEYMMKLSGVTRDMIQCCDGIIAISELCKKILIDNYCVPEEKIIVHYPVSSRLENEPPKKEPGDNGCIVGFSNVNHWIKGMDIVPELIQRLFDKYPDLDCRFICMGKSESEEWREFESKLRNAGAADKVTLIAHQEDPMKTYVSFDIFVLPSREESFSLAVQENAFLGNPIVMFLGATGISEWFDDSSCIQVPYLDIESMADAVYGLCSNAELREKMGINAKRIVTEKVVRAAKVEDIADFISGLS